MPRQEILLVILEDVVRALGEGRAVGVNAAVVDGKNPKSTSKSAVRQRQQSVCNAGKSVIRGTVSTLSGPGCESGAGRNTKITWVHSVAPGDETKGLYDGLGV